MIKDIGTVTVSCGACKDNELCRDSRIETLLANGLSIDLENELTGLKTGWVDSEIYWKLIELQKQL